MRLNENENLFRNSLLGNEMIRIFSKRLKSSSTATYGFYSKNSAKEVNVVASKLPPVKIPDVVLSEYVWNNVSKYQDKTALVRHNLHATRILYKNDF